MSKDAVRRILGKLPTTDAERDLQQRIAEFKRSARLADGQIIPLKKGSKAGKQLYIAIRHAPSSTIQIAENVPAERPLRFLVIDTYVDAGENMLRPVGYFDWVLNGNAATANGSCHSFLRANEYHELSAASRVAAGRSEALATSVVDEFQGEGIGSLMLATSLTALEQLGAESLYVSGITPPGRKMYAKFGLDATNALHASLADILKHPQIDKSIGEFV